jgi:hypothetical protein
VGREVVQDDVHVEALGHMEIDQLEEREDILGGVALLRVEEDLAGRDVENGEEIGRPVALVVMGLGPRAPWRHRQASRFVELAGRSVGLVDVMDRMAVYRRTT